MRFADLHLHTVFSDSTYTPLELVQKAQRVGLSAIAVVDHDTVEGIAPTIEAAKGADLEVIPGIEFTSEFEGLEVHILGYLFDYKNQALLTQLKILKENRVNRVYSIVSKLNDLGVNLEAKKVFDLAGEGTVGRLHIARALMQQGIIGSTSEAFHKYIGVKDPAYVLGFKLGPEKVIELIKNAGGIPVLAHPYSLGRDDLIQKFTGLGLMGLEIYYPEYSSSVIKRYLGVAKKHNLLVTGGSDCHGKAKTTVTIGTIRIPYELVENLKKAREKL